MAAPDFTEHYNTVLSDADERKFQDWLTRKGRQGDLKDYDMRGAWQHNVGQASNGHFPDTWKKPNHPTFSSESVYSNPQEQGGAWIQNGKQWTFQAAPGNLRYWSPDELQQYFGTTEPDSTLVLPQQ
jgi:hypothetical protein